MTRNIITRNATFFSLVVALAPLAVCEASVIYIGDAAAAGQAVTDPGSGPDSANDGEVTYAFPTAAVTNGTGDPQIYRIEEVNFFFDDEFVSSGNVTPFVALFSGPVGDGSSYSVLSVGAPIAATPGVNNVAFTPDTGSSDIVVLEPGESLVAGFFQDGRVVPYGNSGDGDYLFTSGSGNSIPSPPLPADLTADANFDSLSRTYSFNVGVSLVPVPEPSTFLPFSIGMLALVSALRKRRRPE